MCIDICLDRYIYTYIHIYIYIFACNYEEEIYLFLIFNIPIYM